MLPLGSPLGLSSYLPYNYSFKAVLGLLVLLLVLLGGGRWNPSGVWWWGRSGSDIPGIPESWDAAAAH